MQTLRARGFTLVELMVVVAVIAILVVVAAPSVSDWLQNAKTRSVAESVQNGLRYAQAEAASLSRQTTFVTTATAWTVDYINVAPSDTTTAPHPLQVSPAGGLQGAVITPSGTTTAVIAFTSLGRVLGGATVAALTPLIQDATFDVTNPTGSRRLRVVLSQGGKTRMCDPDKILSATTPDGC